MSEATCRAWRAKPGEARVAGGISVYGFLAELAVWTYPPVHSGGVTEAGGYFEREGQDGLAGA
jgi:hypothetical protein